MQSIKILLSMILSVQFIGAIDLKRFDEDFSLINSSIKIGKIVTKNKNKRNRLINNLAFAFSDVLVQLNKAVKQENQIQFSSSIQQAKKSLEKISDAVSKKTELPNNCLFQKFSRIIEQMRSDDNENQNLIKIEQYLKNNHNIQDFTEFIFKIINEIETNNKIINL